MGIFYCFVQLFTEIFKVPHMQIYFLLNRSALKGYTVNPCLIALDLL